MKRLLLLLLLLPFYGDAYTRQDTLRGINGRGRDWWDVTFYELDVTIDTANRGISGYLGMNFHIIGEPRDSMQIDLQEGMELELSAGDEGGPRGSIYNDGNVKWVVIDRSYWKHNGQRRAGDTSLIYTLDFSFHGKPRTAINPPWDGGFIWKKDSMGKPWIAVACQGLGASSWWPCKDYQGDEPDKGMSLRIRFGDTTLNAIVSNGIYHAVIDPEIPTKHFRNKITGRLETIVGKPIGPAEHLFGVTNPINTYNTTFYIGDYAHWHDTLHGEKGVLDLDFYPLRYNEAKARKQWTQAKEMLRCFEWWMGPYPFYEDGYKLVEAPYLGMEHQSAIAYGNHYTNGYYRPTGAIDRSGTGVGMAFDFIIIHESGHEWFGNSITAQDIADNWLHEGFTTYTETLFAEWIKGKDSAFAYAQGEWKNIRNDRPVIGDYGVNDEGSSDKYDKGAAVVHMIRMMINNDSAFRQLLRGLNRDFYHKIVTSKEVEEYISRFVGKDLKPFFDQYLRSTGKPTLEWYVKDTAVYYRWQNAVAGFRAPIRLQLRYRHTDKTTADHPSSYGFRGVTASEVSVLPIGWYDVVKKEF